MATPNSLSHKHKAHSHFSGSLFLSSFIVFPSRGVSDMGLTDLAFTCGFLFLLLANFAASDLAKDREECADQLVGLAPCLPYVGGEAKTPTIDCCAGLKQVLDKSKKCICILIKDRNDPNLGLNINASLAVHLPAACHAPANISECVDLLHLKPNSAEAKVFEGFDKATQTNSSTPVAPSGKGSSPSVSANVQSDGWSVRGKRWLVGEVVCVIVPFVFNFLV